MMMMTMMIMLMMMTMMMTAGFSFVRPVLRDGKFNVGKYTKTGTRLFHICLAYRHHRLLPFYTTFSDPHLALGSQGQRKARPLGPIFSHTFSLIEMKSDVVLKQFAFLYNV